LRFALTEPSVKFGLAHHSNGLERPILENPIAARKLSYTEIKITFLAYVLGRCDRGDRTNYRIDVVVIFYILFVGLKLELIAK